MVTTEQAIDGNASRSETSHSSIVTTEQAIDGNQSTPSELVVSSIADAKDRSPTELDQPLYDTIDPDALNRLLESRQDQESPRIHIQFTYCGCEVTVSDRLITINDDHEQDR